MAKNENHEKVTSIQMKNIITYLKCRWLVEAGVHIASEKRQRVISKESVTTDILAEAAPFTFPLKRGGEKVRASAMARIPSLLNKVLELLEQFAKMAML